MISLAYPGVDTPPPVAPVPLALSATPGGVRHRAPKLGEHSDEILAELGYDAAAIAKLRADGVV